MRTVETWTSGQETGATIIEIISIRNENKWNINWSITHSKSELPVGKVKRINLNEQISTGGVSTGSYVPAMHRSHFSLMTATARITTYYSGEEKKRNFNLKILLPKAAQRSLSSVLR